MASTMVSATLGETMSVATMSVSFGDGDGSFFGLKLDEDKKYNVTFKTNMCFSSFALDPTTMEDDELVTLWIKTDEEFALCSLTKKFPQYNAKFYFKKGSQFTLYLKGKGEKATLDYPDGKGLVTFADTRPLMLFMTATKKAGVQQ